ncbi:RHS repeat-associated core domain-containing protein, partial [Stenotrophomonas sp. CC22-02]|uniref:RHS repeat domain-containing protein n=1 Tax=Stenotrophomonas sp. CC22-02 TaxID=1378087 RepID=UPI001AB02368
PAAAQEVVEYIHTDALGSPVAITDANGQVIERTVYEPYGAVVNRPLTDGPGYTGHVTDSETGLSYMQQRYMDPALGAFLSGAITLSCPEEVWHHSTQHTGNCVR